MTNVFSTWRISCLEKDTCDVKHCNNPKTINILALENYHKVGGNVRGYCKVAKKHDVRYKLEELINTEGEN